MYDGFGREINYLRLSITDLCNLRCTYCMPEEGVCKSDHSQILRFEEITEIVRQLAAMGINKVRLTGGEPLVRKGIVNLVKQLKAIPGIETLAMTTNGLLLSEYAQDLKDAGLDRVNISIDSMKPKVYEKLTRGGDVTKVIEGIRKARQVGIESIKLNVVLIKGTNDDEIMDFIQLTQAHPIDVRFIELMPIGQVASWNEDRFASLEEVLDRVPELQAEVTRDKTSPSVHYRLPSAKGRVGLIRPISCKFCSNCNRIRMTADGHMAYCLHSENLLNIKEVFRAEGSIEEALLNYIGMKPQHHGLDQGHYVKKSMSSIGG